MSTSQKAATQSFRVAPQNQGQIVEYAYAACFGNVVRCIHDRSDGTMEYAVSRMLTDDEGDYWQSVPGNRRWRKITEAEAQEYLND